MMNVFDQDQIHRACPICGSFQADQIYHYQDQFPFFSKLPQEFDIVSCRDCGFVYSDIAASQDIYDEYYAQCSVYDNMGVTYGLGKDDNSIAVYAERAKEIAEFASKADSILEIGSANGFLLEELRKLGFQNLSALDLSEKALDGLAQRGFKTHLGGIFSSHSSNGYHKPLSEQFDVVCLTMVMEHIYDVQGAMQSMKRMLKLGGYLYIEVPDAGHFNEYEAFPFGFFNFEHIGYFDETSLRNLAVWNGFRVADIIHKSSHFSTRQDTYPCITGIFQKPFPMKSSSDAVLREYISSSESKIEKYVDIFADSKEEIAFWGMGTFARQLLKRVDGKWNIKYLIDSNPQHKGKCLLGHQVQLPEILKDEHFSGTICITTALYADEVIEQIQEMHLECKYRRVMEMI